MHTPPLQGAGGLESEGAYQPFEGICLTDTFQLGEYDEKIDAFASEFPRNSERVIREKESPLTVIIGNPPYSVGQKDANDNAQNEHYPRLDNRIASTYAQESTATNKNALYDSYIKAFRWASDRLGSRGGIIGFVTNGGWLDSNGGDGIRKCYEKEFSGIYIFNLRGNCNTSGEVRRKEGDGIFGLGSRTPIAITILVKKPNHTGKATIHYHDIGDYLSKEDKLRIIKEKHDIASSAMEWRILTPNEHGDWISQRNSIFANFIPFAPEHKFTQDQSVFTSYSPGFQTSRDFWAYNFSMQNLQSNIKKTILYYNRQFERTPVVKDMDSTHIKWSSSLDALFNRKERLIYHPSEYTTVFYRPFSKVFSYTEKSLIHRPALKKSYFPTQNHKNLMICITGLGGNYFAVLMADSLFDDTFVKAGNGGTQSYPLYWYEEGQRDLFSGESGYIRHDGVSDWILQEAQERYGRKVNKEDIF